MFYRTFGAFIAALLLSACSGALTVNELVQNSNGNSYIKDSARRGQMETVVVGTVLGADPQAVSHSVTQAMPGTYMGPEMKFTTTSDENNRLKIRTVFLMNAPRGMDIRTLCSDPDTVTQKMTDDGLRIAGGLCKGNMIVRSATARGPKPTSIDDPAFTAYVAAITTHLLSIRNNDRDCGDSPCSGS